MDGNGPAETSVRGRVEGRALAADGRFTVPFASDVTVTVSCAGPWCGSVAGTGERIVFLRREGTGWELRVEPCGGWLFEADRAREAAIAACMTGGACVPSR